MAQCPNRDTTDKEFDQQLLRIIKLHSGEYEPPSKVWDNIQSHLKAKTSEKTMPLVHAFPSLAVVRVSSSIDPDDPTIEPDIIAK